MASRSHYPKDIESISITNFNTTFSDEHIKSVVFYNYKNLKSLCIKGINITGSCFFDKDFPKNITTIDLADCLNLKPSNLMALLKFEKLELLFLPLKLLCGNETVKKFIANRVEDRRFTVAYSKETELNSNKDDENKPKYQLSKDKKSASITISS